MSDADIPPVLADGPLNWRLSERAGSDERQKGLINTTNTVGETRHCERDEHVTTVHPSLLLAWARLVRMRAAHRPVEICLREPESGNGDPALAARTRGRDEETTLTLAPLKPDND